MNSRRLKTLSVQRSSDVHQSALTAKAVATEIGFDVTAGDEIALATIELASNLVRHANGGTIILSLILEGDRRGLLLESQDQGPGITNIPDALTDGFSTIKSLGCGLGTVNRLMDNCQIASRPGPETGTYVSCQRWLRKSTQPLSPCPLGFGAATRMRLGSRVNGDSFILNKWHSGALAGVIDGLGHDEPARLAAETARQYVERHYDRPMAELFLGVHRACRSTRGVVMALARFEWPPVKLTFAGIGNIEARAVGNHSVNFISRRGVVGAGNDPNPLVTEIAWPAGNTLVLHSDGISTRWQWGDIASLDQGPVALVAQAFLRRLAKEDDDATVVIVKAV